MNAKEVLKQALNSSHGILSMFLQDLTDADLLVRPVPGANHIAWQLGHLINAEANYFLPQVPGAGVPELPVGFAQKHNKDAAASDDPKQFCTKAEYLALFDKTRSATLQALEGLHESDLEKKVEGNLARLAPTLGALFQLGANHELMHAGQFSVVRRKLGKPVLF